MNLIRLSSATNLLEYGIEGALDTLEAPAFLQTVLADYADGTPRPIVLDCTAMPYLTSSGLRAIMTIGKTLKKDGQKLVLHSLQGLALEIYTSSGFATIFPLAEDRERARQLAGAGQ